MSSTRKPPVHIEIDNPDDHRDVPIYGGPVEDVGRYLEPGTYRGFTYDSRRRQGPSWIVVHDDYTVTAGWVGSLVGRIMRRLFRETGKPVTRQEAEAAADAELAAAIEGTGSPWWLDPED